MHRYGIVAAAAATISVSLAACGSVSSGTGGSATSGSGGTRTFTIGVDWSLSGSFSPYGQAPIDGARLAVQQVNSAGGIQIAGKKYNLALKVVDDRSDQQTSQAMAIKLIKDDGLNVLLGPLGPLEPGVEQITAADNVIDFGPGTSASVLAGTSKYPLLFSTNPNPAGEAHAVAAAAHSFLPAATRVAIVGPDDADGQGLSPALQSAFQAAGDSVQTFLYPATSTDLSVVLTKVATYKPDIIFAGWDQADWDLSAASMNSSGIPKTTTIIANASDASDAKTFGGRPFIALPVAAADFSVPNPTPAATAFKNSLESFLKTTQLPPNPFSSEFFYSSVLVLAKALQSAQSVSDTTAIAKALRTVSVQAMGASYSFGKGNIADFPEDITFIDGSQAITKAFE